MPRNSRNYRNSYRSRSSRSRGTYGSYGPRGGRTHFRRRRFTGTSLTERLLILLVIAVIAGVSAGIGLPKISPTLAKVTGETAASGPAVDVLNTLAVDDGQNASGYDRDAFGYRETDDDGNGCDIREDILARDLKDVTFKGLTGHDACTVKSGTLDDPYTGKTIRFTRGVHTSTAVQIDHVVALENAWQSGARDWDTAKRYRYGNDPYNLLAVDGPANQEKGSASAAYWLPTNGDYRCDYVARQIGVKAKYGLSVTTAEKDAMLAVLHGCPGEEVPKDR
ncbi:HNH endonuclease family protein [Bifidobacterium saguinibicoloris]|uniref:HNH endonuclease family protein n=1 Tax=Bifidobacterium saguinibicoloris TaxID=2834433 RepID=UPI001C5944DD|nr:HNH endonuclease family protein [Bifidobacterium saguinibicoloris]MBW3081175.1 HNH endonuclease [Bifidobacterium saguinibicoloris]